MGEFQLFDRTDMGKSIGYRQVLVGPQHPYVHQGMAMDFPGVNYSQNDYFNYQARAFLEQVAGLTGKPGTSPACPDFTHGLHNQRLLDAVVASAQAGGAEITI